MFRGGYGHEVMSNDFRVGAQFTMDVFSVLLNLGHWQCGGKQRCHK